MAALLARTGQVEEALTIVKAIRERHDGFKRNPFSENEKVRKEVYEMMNWWVKKGVDGFRMDVINFISKVPGLPESADVEVGYGEYGKWSVSPWKLTELKGIFGKWQKGGIAFTGPIMTSPGQYQDLVTTEKNIGRSRQKC